MKEIFAEDIRALDSLRETEKKIAAAEEGSDEYRSPFRANTRRSTS